MIDASDRLIRSIRYGKSERISICVTQDEKEYIKKYADEHGISMGETVRIFINAFKEIDEFKKKEERK